MRLHEFTDDKKIEEYINEIGDFRFKRIIPKIKELDIMNLKQVSDGTFRASIMPGFRRYTTQDIENIITEIRNGEMDI